MRKPEGLLKTDIYDKKYILTIFIYYCIVLKPNNINNLKNIIPRTYEFHEWCIKPPILMYRNNKMHLIYNNKCQQSQYSTYKQVPFIFLIISIILFIMILFHDLYPFIRSCNITLNNTPYIKNFQISNYPLSKYRCTQILKQLS